MYGLSNWNITYLFMLAVSIRKTSLERTKHRRVEAAHTPSSMPGTHANRNFLGVNLGSDGFAFRERIEEIERNEVLPRPVPSV
jgi:hypothetical protein